MKTNYSILCAIISLLNYSIFAQKSLPILKSNTKTISIKEGNSLYKNTWIISPEVPLDVFVTNPFEKVTTIVFYSDIDSLVFKVKPNKKYNFIAELPGNVKALTQINTNQKASPTLEPKLVYKKSNNKTTHSDTIPFILTEKDQIIVNGKINKSDNLKFLFDLNAGANVITEKASIDKVMIKIDGSQENMGSDGVATIKNSLNNQLEINGLIWEKVKLLVIPYKNKNFDAVLSWRCFENKIIELDYEKKLIIIHSKPPLISSEYSKLEMKLLDGNPFVKCTLLNGNRTVEEWFGYDTGANGTLACSQKFSANNTLNNTMDEIGTAKSTGSTGLYITSKTVRLPKLTLGKYELYNVPLDINDSDPDGNGDHNELLGLNILKRFNAIINFKDNEIYIKPNNLFYSPIK